MPKRILLYVLLVFLITLSSCQKEDNLIARDYKTLGSSAGNLLSSRDYQALNIQILYMPDYMPDSMSIENLKSFLKRYINKPGGISVFTKEIPASGKTVLTLDDVVKTEKQFRSIFTQQNTIAVSIVVTDGYYSKKDVFATSYWNTSFCLFGKTIKDNSGGVLQLSRTNIFTTILEHEFGHLLGLVGQGSAMQENHKDTQNGAHCNNTSCLMFFNVESSGFANAAYKVPLLDANCEADLKANGGK